MTRYFTTDGFGNLGNQLYYALHAEVMSARTGDNWVFVPTGYSLECGFPEAAKRLNLGRYVGEGTPEVRVSGTYMQEFGKHFTMSDLGTFVSKSLMGADMTEVEFPHNRFCDLLVVIRNGDYLLPQYDRFNYFDRTEYLRRAFEHVPQDPRYGTLCVSSEDTELCEKQFGWLFREKFGDRVRYLPKTEPWRDLLRNSLYQHQIITNTTFGYWGAFVSNMRYRNSKGCVIAPWGFSTDEMNGNRNSVQWFTVDCPVVRGR